MSILNDRRQRPRPDYVSTEAQAAHTADLLHELTMRSLRRALAGEEADVREVYEEIRKERGER